MGKTKLPGQKDLKICYGLMPYGVYWYSFEHTHFITKCLYSNTEIIIN